MKDEADVPRFFDAIDDLFLDIMLGVRFLGVCESKGNAGEFSSEFWQFIRMFLCCGFEFCPFAPKIEVAGIFEGVRDIRAANAACHLEQKDLARCRALQKLGVRYAAIVFECLKEMCVDGLEASSESRSIWDC